MAFFTEKDHCVKEFFSIDHEHVFLEELE